MVAELWLLCCSCYVVVAVLWLLCCSCYVVLMSNNKYDEILFE